MKIKRCNEGHFYDEDKYVKCPLCFPEEGNKGIDNTEQYSLQRGVRNGSPEYLRWKDAERSSDENRTMMEDESEALIMHCYITGWLVCVQGPEKGRDYRIRHGFNQIGRSHRMDICIFDDDAISRNVHCSIVYEDRKNQFLLIPGNGSLTWKDDVLVQEPTLLKTGDRFKIGETVLEFIAFCRDDIKWKK